MADYSYIRRDGQIMGLWLKNPKLANDPMVLMPMISRNHELSGPLMAHIIGKKYKVCPNKFNDAGGCFVMFFGTPAPGQIHDR